MYWTTYIESGPRRVNHAAVAVDNLIYSFGGYWSGGDYNFCGPIDIHILNTNKLIWSLLPDRVDLNGVQLKPPDVPFQRYGHTVVAYDKKIYLWGGRNDIRTCNTLYCFDTETLTWSRPQVTGIIPGARDAHSACTLNHQMYIFGGFEDNIDQFSRDVHYLDLKTMNWSYITTIGKRPSYRDFHSATVVNNRMYIFGGRGDKHSPYHSTEETYCTDIMYLDLKLNRWHRPKTTGNIPIGRRSHSMFVHNNLIYVFGGYNGLLDQHFNDLYYFDTKRNHWNLIKPRGKAPTPRRRLACIVIGDKMFLFCGTSPTNELRDRPGYELNDNNDTHVLDFNPSLKTLAIMVVIENELDSSCLPKEIRSEIRSMTTFSSIARPKGQSG